MSVYDCLSLWEVRERILHYFREALAALGLFAHLEVDVRCSEVLLYRRLEPRGLGEVLLHGYSLALLFNLHKGFLVDLKQLLVHQVVVIYTPGDLNEVNLSVVLIQYFSGLVLVAILV